jgi:hypothetical protein
MWLESNDSPILDSNFLSIFKSGSIEKKILVGLVYHFSLNVSFFKTSLSGGLPITEILCC